LSNSERVGIGNVNPQTKLDVSGSFRAQSANIDNTIIADEISANIATINKNLSTDDFVANTATIANTLSAGAFAANSAVISGAFGSNSATISGALSANTATISGALNANSATVSGTLATNKLRVADLLCAKEIKVNLTPCWPDYVFKKNYNLMPLQELEQFVNKNHHLPEIPSAATVEENGIELGEMNAKFLKKIEELTLYIIDLQKQIDELKNK